MKYTIYCLGNCGTILGHGEINMARPFARPTQGWCFPCNDKRIERSIKAEIAKTTGGKG